MRALCGSDKRRAGRCRHAPFWWGCPPPSPAPPKFAQISRYSSPHGKDTLLATAERASGGWGDARQRASCCATAPGAAGGSFPPGCLDCHSFPFCLHRLLGQIAKEMPHPVCCFCVKLREKVGLPFDSRPAQLLGCLFTPNMAGGQEAGVVNLALQVLEKDRDELTNAVAHLERSIRELRAEMAATGPDADYKEAINDNVVTVVRYRTRIASLQEEMVRVRRGVSTCGGVALSTDAPAAAAATGAGGSAQGRQAPAAAAAALQAGSSGGDVDMVTAPDRAEQQQQAAAGRAGGAAHSSPDGAWL